MPPTISSSAPARTWRFAGHVCPLHYIWSEGLIKTRISSSASAARTGTSLKTVCAALDLDELEQNPPACRVERPCVPPLIEYGQRGKCHEPSTVSVSPNTSHELEDRDDSLLEHRHDDRQHRSSRRRREPTARTKQRPGRSRHGLPAPPGSRLSPGQRSSEYHKQYEEFYGAHRFPPRSAGRSRRCMTPPSLAN